MNRTLRSNKKNEPPNVLGITGRQLTSGVVPRFFISQCFKTDGGQTIYLDHTNVHDPTLIPKRVALSAADILRESGVYTWILTKVASAAGDRYEIVGSKAFTEYEIGSKHRDLYYDAGQPIVYAAGEVQVIRKPQEVEVNFNLESGTFMQDIVKEYSAAQAALVQAQAIEVAKTPIEYYKTFMEPLWAYAGATIVRYTNEPLMSKIPKTLTKSVIDAYRKAGYVPYTFTYPGECELYKVWRLLKHKMGDQRDYITYLNEEFPTLPEELKKLPVVFVGGNRNRTRRNQNRRTRRTQRTRQKLK
jgi:hypothetical protein